MNGPHQIFLPQIREEFTGKSMYFQFLTDQWMDSINEKYSFQSQFLIYLAPRGAELIWITVQRKITEFREIFQYFKLSFKIKS